MIKYEIEGKIVEAEGELSEAEIDEIGAQIRGSSAPVRGEAPAQEPGLISKTMQAVQGALPGGQEAIQPLDIKGSNGAMAGFNAAIQSLRNPGRISATTSANAENAGGTMAEELGKRGVSPWIAAPAGFVTSIVTDPMSYTGMGAKAAPKLDKATQNLVKQADNFGLTLTPGEIKQSKPLLLLERALENTPGGAKVLAPLRQKRMEQLVKLRDSLVAEGGEPQAIEKIGLEIQDLASKTVKMQEGIQKAGSAKLAEQGAKQLGVSQEAPEVLASKTLEAIKKASQEEQGRVSAVFNELEAILPPGQKVYPKNTIELANKMKSQLQKAAPSLRNDRLLSILNDFTPPVDDVGQAGGKALTLSWQQLKANREALTQMINSADGAAAFGVKGGGGIDSGVLKQLKSALSTDMEELATRMGGEVSETYNLARTMHGAFKDRFNNDVIRSVIKTADQRPEKFMQTVFAPGRTTEIKNVRQIIGEKRFGALKDRFTATLFGLDNPAAQFNPSALRQQIRHYKPNMLKEVYGPQAYDEMVRLAEVVEKTGTLPINNTFARSVIARSPEKVMNFIVQPNNTQNIVKAKALLGEERWNSSVSSWLDQNILAKSPEATVNPKQFTDLIYKYGEPVLEATFGKAQAGKLKQLGAVLRLVERGEAISVNKSQTAGVSGMMGLLTHPISALFKLAGSTIVAKAYTSPKAVDLMIRGYAAIPGSQTALATAKQLAVILGVQGYQEYVEAGSPLPR